MRSIWHGLRLLWVLVRLPRPDVVLVQTPPATPTMAVSWLAARVRRARLVIDWHNLAHTVLAVRLGDDHRAVKALRHSERRWARRADAHLAVSQTMADWLAREWRVSATVVYDRPPAHFARPTPSSVDALWHRLAEALHLETRRLPLVVCPTSWTPDEDFDLLIEALERADRTLTGQDADHRSARLAVILTGRGELRGAVEQRLTRRQFTAIAVRTTWIDPADYPTLIGMADLGVCLHQSSSGLDLPMKIADFRGAGVPVCAFDYSPVLSEVLTSGREGVTFREPGELSAVLVALATGDVARAPAFAQSREWLSTHPADRWDDEWTRARSVLGLPAMPV